MRHSPWRVLAVCLALACVACNARADTAIALFESFAGNVNFVGTQKTMRTSANPQTAQNNGQGNNGQGNNGQGNGQGNNGQNACSVVSAATELTADLSGIPAGATILRAQLYWAGSGSSTSADYTINFEGAPVSAPPGRKYASSTIGGGFDYFGGAVDVTAQVVAKRNGTYKFSGLDINNGAPYCAVEGVVGGFALLVIYANASEPFRVLNLYEGFQYIRNSSVTLNLSNFRIPTPLGTATGRIGHITWEGDATLGANGEDLLFNNHQMTDTLNPPGNQFNSASNINNDAASYGIDFDAYTVGSTNSVIAAGQTSASTVYKSGQDLVLLNAEIIAVPNVPVADLGIAMQRTGALMAQANTAYTLTITNYGPNPESGPMTVTDTLPTGLAFVSASGTGWGCGAAGQVVTCTYAGSLTVNASLPAITLTAKVSGTGAITNTAGVGGQLFDNVAANNTASDTGTVTAPIFVLTDKACSVGLPIDSSGQCNQFGSSPVVAGTTPAVYVTALVNGVAATLGAGSYSMNFALSCVNPTTGAGVNAMIGSTALPSCVANGAVPAAWSSNVAVGFAGNSPSSAPLAFNYNDVGQVRLYLRDPSNNVLPSPAFVSKPATFKLTAIQQGGTLNLSPTGPTDSIFVKAGTAFSMTVSSLTSAGMTTPNFGRETTPAKFKLTTPVAILKVNGDPYPELAQLPPIAGSFNPVSAGTAIGNAFSWGEVGIVMVAPALESGNYLGSGDVTGTASRIGRFIPDHFDTFVSSSRQCLSAPGTNMGCPPTVAWAAYSGQAFSAKVEARSASNTLIQNYAGEFARAVTLKAYDQPGGSVANPPAGALLSANDVPPTLFGGGSATAAPVYTLPFAYQSSAPHALNWTAPSTIHLRAEAFEPNGSAGAVAITSNRAAASVEGGVRVVSGRLMVTNVHGADRLKMPVPLEAQYWSTAGRWETSSNDADAFPATSAAAFSGCTGAFGPPCNALLALVSAPASVALAGGRSFVTLKPPGSGKTGRGELRINGPAWLPSTVGRVTFGVYTSPLLYLREVY